MILSRFGSVERGGAGPAPAPPLGSVLAIGGSGSLAVACGRSTIAASPTSATHPTAIAPASAARRRGRCGTPASTEGVATAGPWGEITIGVGRPGDNEEPTGGGAVAP